MTRNMVRAAVLGLGVILAASVADAQRDLSRTEAPETVGENMRLLMPGGALPNWCEANNKITFTKLIGVQYEVFVMSPDGTGVECLTSNKAALEACGHRGASYWHPSGEYIAFTAENSAYERKGNWTTARPGIGRNHDIWIMTADGDRFWRLTDYPDNWGAIEPKFSHDGTMVYWNEEYSMELHPEGKPEDPEPHPGSWWGWESFDYRRGEEVGAWRVVFGDVAFTDDGPEVTNVRRVKPPEGHTLIEANGFTPDDKGFIYCYAVLAETRGIQLWGEFFTSDLDGGNFKRLTQTQWRHDEDPVYSPDGTKIAFKEVLYGKGMPNEGAEIFIMDADGENWKQITHFHVEGHAQYRDDWLQIAEFDWSPDATQLVIAPARGSKDAPLTLIRADLYLLTLPPGVAGNAAE